MTTVLTGDGVTAYRFLSIRAQLKLEKMGLKSSGGPLRPRLQCQAEWAHLKPRDSHDKYIAACDAKLKELGHPDFQS